MFGSIRSRLIYGTLALAVLPLVAASALIAYFAYRDASQSLSTRVTEQLTSIQTVKRDELKGYFDQLEGTVRVLAQGPDLAIKLSEFQASFADVAAELEVPESDQRAALTRYYREEFGGNYQTRNPGGQADISRLVGDLPPSAVALQYLYIADNPNPLGQKNLLDRVPERTASYHQLHAELQPVMRKVINTYGFYDVFLIDAESGNIVYTYFKELDFATSLVDGPWAGTGLAEAFLAARGNDNPERAVLIGFRKYLPSYDDAAAFFAFPVQREGRTIGVFAAQVPIDRIEQIANFGRNWREAGLGNSGELVLVGPDQLTRANGRDMIESADRFLPQLQAAGIEPSLLATMEARKTSFGLLKVGSAATTAALAGERGVGAYRNVVGESVLGAWSPVDIAGSTWALTAEIKQDEALAPAQALLRNIVIGALAITLGLALLAGFIATRLARGVNQPIERLAHTVRELSAGNMDARAKLSGQDELGQLGSALDQLLDERVATLTQAARENEQLNESVITIMQAVGQLAQNDLSVRVPVTADVTGAVADAINLLVTETSSALRNVLGVANQVAQASIALRTRTTTVFDTATNSEREVQAAAQELKTAAEALATVAREADEARDKAEDALRASTQGLRIVSDTVQGVTASREQIRETEKRVKRLAERSTEINAVVNIINQISERTAVLALNAGMQAAAAGDAGRGFAVVADEVKRLADSARNATSQISTLVTGIQADAADTMRSMNDALTQFVDITRLAEKAGEEAQTSMSATDELATAVRSIAGSSSAQARISGTLVERAQRIDQATRSTLEELNRQRENVQSLLTQAKMLLDTVRVFKLPQS